MRAIHVILIAVIVQAVAFAGCAGSSTTASKPTASPAADVAAPVSLLTCGKNERICYSCDGSRQFCAQFCPDCIPPAHEPVPATPAEVAFAGPQCDSRVVERVAL